MGTVIHNWSRYHFVVLKDFIFALLVMIIYHPQFKCDLFQWKVIVILDLNHPDLYFIQMDFSCDENIFICLYTN
jgi:hypothetical protein